MRAHGSHESITSSASPKKPVLVPNLLKEATLPYPSTIAIGIFAIHLIFPPFLQQYVAHGGDLSQNLNSSAEVVKLAS